MSRRRRAQASAPIPAACSAVQWPRELPPYRLLLHNDDVNTMAQVVAALLVSVPELAPEEVVAVMLEAHEQGQAQVIVCPLERVEVYRDRLEGQRLTATIEQA